MEGSLSAPWMMCLGFRYWYDHVAKVVRSRMANYFQISPPFVFSYRLFIFSNRGNFQVGTWVRRKFAAENRVNFQRGIGQESNGAANQEKQIFLLSQISPSASSTRDGERDLWNFCSLSSALCTLESKYLYLLWIVRVNFLFLCDLFKDYKKRI